jgi:hypothetical protein
MMMKRFGRRADNRRADIWPLFEHRLVFLKADGLSHDWTGGVYNAVKAQRIPEAVEAGEKDRPTAGPLYEIKLHSPETGMLLARFCSSGAGRHACLTGFFEF